MCLIRLVHTRLGFTYLLACEEEDYQFLDSIEKIMSSLGVRSEVQMNWHGWRNIPMASNWIHVSSNYSRSLSPNAMLSNPIVPRPRAIERYSCAESAFYSVEVTTCNSPGTRTVLCVISRVGAYHRGTLAGRLLACLWHNGSGIFLQRTENCMLVHVKRRFCALIIDPRLLSGILVPLYDFPWA